MASIGFGKLCLHFPSLAYKDGVGTRRCVKLEPLQPVALTPPLVSADLLVGRRTSPEKVTSSFTAGLLLF
jgi:hypothetical protein